MSPVTMVRHLGRLVLAAAVVGSLSFGASQLFAGNTSDCPYPPYYGPCADPAECEALCFALFPEHGGNGHCNLADHCCICAER
jgi:hypothetical protein